MLQSGSLLDHLPKAQAGEIITQLAASTHARLERIVSNGQHSPPGFWYDQAWDEWVFLIAGSAGVLIEGEASTRILRPGDYLELPAKVRHRVEWTNPDGPTVWLAVHLDAGHAQA